jgi:predicted small lipoprotein YifL
MKRVLSMILIASCLTLAACGKKGDLEAPSLEGHEAGL